jgi:hypothetical protein
MVIKMKKPPILVTKAKTPKQVDIVVSLPTADHRNASLAAKFHNETVSQWISSLVNTALQP